MVLKGNPMITLETIYEDVFAGFSPNYPMVEYYVGDEKRLMYAKDFKNKTKAVGAFLEKALEGVEKGRWIGLKYPTHPLWMNVFYGLAMIGYKVMLLDEGATPLYVRNAVELGRLAAIVGTRGEDFPVVSIPFEDAVAAEAGEPSSTAWESIMCLCTSGTTGSAKAVVFQAKTLTRIQRTVRCTIFGNPFTMRSAENLDIEQMRMMATLPMRHVFGFQAPSVFVGFGCTLVFPKNPGVLEMVRTIREEKIWTTYGVPAVWKSIFNVYRNKVGGVGRESFSDFFGEQFRHGLIGGTKIDEELAAFVGTIDFCMGNAYGSTETGGCIALGFLNDVKSMEGPAGYSGQLFNAHAAGVIVEDGSWQPQGMGELAVTGKNIADGFLREGEFVSRQEVHGELYRTGDVFQIRGDDFYCVGRVDNMILNDAGENIYVEELEEDFELLRDKVGQYCAVGFEGRPVLALFRPASDEGALIREILQVNNRLPHYKRIELVFVTAGPLPSTSKQEVDRNAVSISLTEWNAGAGGVRKYNMRKGGVKE